MFREKDSWERTGIQTMVNRFEIDGVTYTAKPFDFAMVCDLEEYGVSISSANKAGMSFVRAYFAICADIEKDEAARRIQNHMVKGGNLEGITSALTKEMNDSDFFHALSNKNKQTEEENHTESETEAKKRGRKPNVTANVSEA